MTMVERQRWLRRSGQGEPGIQKTQAAFAHWHWQGGRETFAATQMQLQASLPAFTVHGRLMVSKMHASTAKHLCFRFGNALTPAPTARAAPVALLRLAESLRVSRVKKN